MPFVSSIRTIVLQLTGHCHHFSLHQSLTFESPEWQQSWNSTPHKQRHHGTQQTPQVLCCRYRSRWTSYLRRVVSEIGKAVCRPPSLMLFTRCAELLDRSQAEKAVSGFKGAKHKSMSSETEAKEWLAGHLDAVTVTVRQPGKSRTFCASEGPRWLT